MPLPDMQQTQITNQQQHLERMLSHPKKNEIATKPKYNNNQHKQETTHLKPQLDLNFLQQRQLQHSR